MRCPVGLRSVSCAAELNTASLGLPHASVASCLESRASAAAAVGYRTKASGRRAVRVPVGASRPPSYVYASLAVVVAYAITRASLGAPRALEDV
jgi:hypothetical protein